MAEETAGIGEAGALVNRATAPQDMAITKGIIQSQNNALRKAQMEAKKLAAIDAIKEKQGKYLSQVGIGKYKNQSVLDKVKEKAKETSAKIYDAGGNQQAIYEAIGDYEGYERDASILDNYLEDFNYKKGFLRLEGAKKAIENNKTEDWINKQHELVKPLIKDENGMLENPQVEELQLGTEFEQAARLTPRTFLEQKEIGNSKSRFVMQASDEAVQTTANDLLKNERYLRYLPFDKNFQKYYDNNKGTYETLPKLMTNFTFENVRDAARKQDQIQSIYSQQAAQKKATDKTTNEIKTNIEAGRTATGYIFYKPDENGWRNVNTEGVMGNPAIHMTENGSNKIYPNRIRRIDNNTFEIEGIAGKLVPYKNPTRKPDGKILQENDPYTIRVSENDVVAAYGLDDPYLNAYYPKSKKAAKVVAPSGAKKAEGAKGTPKKLNIKASTNTLSMFGVDTNNVKSNKQK
jgi:hypothetical protein